MIKDKVKLSSRGIKLTQANKDYLYEKINHLKKFDKYIKHIEFEITDNKSQSERLSINANIAVIKDIIRITEKGNDLYELIDLSEKKIKQQLEKIKDKLTDHEKITNKEFNQEDEIGEDKLENEKKKYEPIITKTIIYSDNTPLDPTEAIRQMEALGNSSFLFKSKKTNKYTMVYTREDFTYGLVEPEIE